MNKKDLNSIISFAKANSMMDWAFEDVLNEYLTTKEVAESYENFSYFNKPITEISDKALISWYILFLNGADYSDPQAQMEYDIFRAECKNRDEKFNQSVDHLASVI